MRTLRHAKRSTLAAAGWAALMVALLGCGGPSASLRVDEKVVSQFPPEARLWVYDAENEVIIALDNHDAAQAKIQAVEQDIKRAETALDAAKKRNQGEDQAKARLKWQEARKETAEAALDAAEVAVICARGALELNKAKLVVRFDILGDQKKFSVKAFEKQHENCARDLVERNHHTDKLRAEAKKLEDEWRKARENYISRTGDHDHGLWID